MGTCLKRVLFNGAKWGGALIIYATINRCDYADYDPVAPVFGSIKSIQACWATPTVLGLVGNEWELARFTFQRGEMGGGSNNLCYNKPV